MPTPAELDRIYNTPGHFAWFAAGGWKYLNNHLLATGDPIAIPQSGPDTLAGLKEAAAATVEQAYRIPKA